jgi:hypothetical protein
MRSIAALMVVGGALAMSAAAAQAPHASSNSCLTPYRRGVWLATNRQCGPLLF